MKSKVFLILVMAACLTQSACGGCGQWVVRDNTDYLQDPTFDVLAESVPSPVPEISKNASEKERAQPTTKMEMGEGEIDISGRWKFDLNGSLGEDSPDVKNAQASKGAMSIILIQSGSRVQGYGNWTKGDAVQDVTATGTLEESSLSLDVKSAFEGKSRQCTLAAQYINGTLTGQYSIVESDFIVERGNATAERCG